MMACASMKVMHCNVKSNKKSKIAKKEEENSIKTRRKGLNEYAEN